ncbi:MAG: isoaspartyl peptidase/L-asparaginase [Deltaproteobacteria bacterium]|nr:isoaspartyl peptidase/L-asparaginase [Deltaproteobacteria bacterium]
MPRPALIVHGGAGTLAPEVRAAAEAGCAAAVRAGWRVLTNGGSAVAAVAAAVIELEDDSMFNAGVGSVLTAMGTIEMDASIMDGATLAAGACGAVSRVRNPITLARALMADPVTVMLVGPGAEAFAAEHAVAMCAPEVLITPRQRLRWQSEQKQASPAGTVGAVAVDSAGHVAAATSTGGLFYKRPGRIGDSAVLGAGTYADDRLGAASATGRGEAIMRVTLAKTVADMLGAGTEPMAAARAGIAVLAERTGAAAGVIVTDAQGRIGFAHNTAAMPVAFREADGHDVVLVC